MSVYFSIANDGFYHSGAGVKIPDDAIELTDSQYKHLLHELNTENKKLVLENGQLVTKKRNPELTWDMIRSKRNKLLAKSDYTQMPDWPGNSRAWADYRQKLRDLPDEFNDPNEVIWPKQPI